MQMKAHPDAVRELACSGDLDEVVDGVVRQYQKKEKAAGSAAGIIRNSGEAKTWGNGYTNSAHSYQIDGETLFALGSVSKGVTGEVVAGLVIKGQLRWDGKLSDRSF